MISRLLQIWKNVANIRFKMGPPRLLQVIEIYFNITWGGGLPNLLQYHIEGGGVYRDPKFVLRDKLTALTRTTDFGQFWPIFAQICFFLARFFPFEPFN